MSSYLSEFARQRSSGEKTNKFSEIQRQKQRISFRNGDRSSNNASDKVLLQELMLLSWILVKGVPFNAMDDSFFLEYHDICYWTRPPSRRRLSGRLLDTLYEIVMEEIRKDLQFAEFFSLTADGWTSKAQESFIGLTIHFLTENVELRSFCLSVIPLTASHTWLSVAHAIAVRLSNAVREDALLICTSTDTASNMLKVARGLQSNIDIADIDGLGPDDWNKPMDIDDADVEGNDCYACSCVSMLWMSVTVTECCFLHLTFRIVVMRGP